MTHSSASANCNLSHQCAPASRLSVRVAHGLRAETHVTQTHLPTKVIFLGFIRLDIMSTSSLMPAM